MDHKNKNSQAIELRKNAREVFRIERQDFKGNDLLNLRVWYEEGNEMRPGKQGIAIRTELVPELISAIERVSNSENA